MGIFVPAVPVDLRIGGRENLGPPAVEDLHFDMIDRRKRSPGMEGLIIDIIGSVRCKNIRKPVVTGVELNTDLIAESAPVPGRIHCNHCVASCDRAILVMFVNRIVNITQRVD